MPTIDAVRNLVQPGHQFGNDTPEETLNRLWNKHLEGRKEKYGTEFVSSAPKALNAENTSVVSEKWSSDDLGNLIYKDRTRPLEGDENTPVVIIRHRDRDCLLDGGRRITKWRRANPPTFHETWIVALLT